MNIFINNPNLTRHRRAPRNMSTDFALEKNNQVAVSNWSWWACLLSFRVVKVLRWHQERARAEKAEAQGRNVAAEVDRREKFLRYEWSTHQLAGPVGGHVCI